MYQEFSYKFTRYFEEVVLRKRPYVTKELAIYVIEHSQKTERQDDNRYRFWKRIQEFENRALRVVTLEDKRTIHNAFLDRNFKDEN